ncbi:MAG: ROK family protein, partial [Planctomycetota bacterium]
MGHGNVYIGIDIGAGSGAKIGLFDERHRLLDETLLSRAEYGEGAESLADALAGSIRALAGRSRLADASLDACGIATPGLLRSDGSYLLANNLPGLKDQNLPRLLGERLGVPVGIENDANAGGLAEWSVLKTELLYWVLGGGWGGAWISPEGAVRFPALDWDGRDASLHPTNEPGYSIPLSKRAVERLCRENGVSYERLEAILIEDFDPAGGSLSDPSGREDALRAEA